MGMNMRRAHIHGGGLVNPKSFFFSKLWHYILCPSHSFGLGAILKAHCAFGVAPRPWE